MEGQETSDSPIYRRATPEQEIEPSEDEVEAVKESIIQSKVKDLSPYGDESDPVLLDKYFKRSGHPYAVDYFDIKPIYDQVWETGDNLQDLHQIELYLNTELEKRGFNKGQEAANQVLREAEEELGLSEHLNVFERMKKVALYLRVKTKDQKIQEYIEQFKQKIRKE